MDKKIGYILLFGGIGTILFSVIMIWRVFTGVVPPPGVIDIKAFTIPFQGNQLAMPLDPQYSKMANLSIYFLLMLFIAGAGSKIATLGVKLIKADVAEPKSAAIKK